MAFELVNHFVQLTVAADGAVILSDPDSGARLSHAGPLARLRVGETWHAACRATILGGDRLQLGFAGVGAEATATLSFAVRPGYFVIEVEQVEAEGVDELCFMDITPINSDSFAACALALDLLTNVPEIPGLGSTGLRASCWARFGMTGARAALVGAPADQLRDVLQEAVRDDLRLPYSTIGGPFALDAPVNRGSYLFNFDGVTLDNVDAWIELLGTLGFDQLDFHGGRSFRFGDCRPAPELYPNGFTDLKAVIDRLHDAGISAGLHTYAFFIDKACSWVTPIPDPRLAKDATFTLAADLADSAETPTGEVLVEEPTAHMSTTTGFFVRNSVTLQIDDELILYSGVGAHGFSGCERGACGTRVAAHEAGTPVHHLKECFGLFVPDAETSLLAEVAAASATAYNECGFDMIYLDALDGEDILGGADVSWHYGSSFVMELWKRLERPALMEMSTFHHHLWYVRSRMGAWDHPRRSHKRFIDIHCESNQACDRMFLPANLGWWAFKTFSGPEGEPTFADDIEYWCAKAIGTGAGLSLMGTDPTIAAKTPVLPRLAQIVRRYEELRRSGKVAPAVRARLAEPGAEFTLEGDGDDAHFRPVHCARHKVEAPEDWSSSWSWHNPYAAQRPTVRIEGLQSVGPYAAPDNLVLADFADTTAFTVRETAAGLTVQLESADAPGTPAAEQLSHSGHLHASNASDLRDGAWVRIGRVFTPLVDLSQHPALGLWIHGDGGGQLLNVQLRSPEHVSHAIGEHYITIDFTGWRYVELVEAEGERFAQQRWPYGNMYSIYRESVRAEQIGSLDLWLNHVAPGTVADCFLGPIRALPLRPTVLRRPRLTVGGRSVMFPVDLESGQYLEWLEDGCILYGPQGEILRQVAVDGELDDVPPGDHDVQFRCEPAPDGLRQRARVTLFSRGVPL